MIYKNVKLKLKSDYCFCFFLFILNYIGQCGAQSGIKFSVISALLQPDCFSQEIFVLLFCCLLYTSPSPRDGLLSRMPSSA